LLKLQVIVKKKLKQINLHRRSHNNKINNNHHNNNNLSHNNKKKYKLKLQQAKKKNYSLKLQQIKTKKILKNEEILLLFVCCIIFLYVTIHYYNIK